uniref:desmoplakin-like n=1 Tax=Ciona intestinalis TaxID=7719 RepID=UPI000EF4CC01|nr:desmoplakin-like [Ciona intestinalis]|eukprot:XP_026689896.1 desmoplakin-like [Ciona intestinalis]
MNGTVRTMKNPAPNPRIRNLNDHTGGDDGSKKKVSSFESSDSETETKKPEVKTRSSSSSSSSDEENNDGRNGKEENSSVPVTVSQLNFKDTHSSSSSSSESDKESNISQDEITELKITPVEAGAETLDAPSTPIMTPSKRREDITFTSGWRKAVKLLDLIRAGLVRESTVKKLEFGEKEEKDLEDELQPFLSGRDPIAGLLVEETNKKISFYDACKKGIIRRGTAVSLLEAQAATGSIIDPNSAEKMSVKEATKCGLIDRQFQAVLERAERAVLGYKSRLSTEPMSLFDAMNRKLVVESHGIRLLEAQIATGGIIDPFANHRLPVEAAFERGLFDRRLEQILEDPSDDTKGFFDPNTNENLTYLELVERCVTDEETGLPLLQLVSKDRKKEYLSKYQPKFLS